MDGLDFTDRLAKKARAHNPGKIDVSARVMATIREKSNRIDLTPVYWYAGASALAAVSILIAALTFGSIPAQGTSMPCDIYETVRMGIFS